MDDIVPVKSLVGLLHTTAALLSTSCKRMSVWESILSENSIGSEKLKRLKKIGEKLWWSKQAALERILGTFEDPSKGTYSTLIKVLHHVQASPDFHSKSTNDTDALLQTLLHFDTIRTAFLLLRVCSILRHASDYLQAKGLGCHSAWKMVEKAKRKLCEIQFNEINDRVQNFISAMKEELDDIDAEMQTELEKCRGRACPARKYRMKSQMMSDRAFM